MFRCSDERREWTANSLISFVRAVFKRGSYLPLRLLLWVLCAITAAAFLVAQPEGKRITFYTAQTSYVLPVIDRNGVEYVGLLETLEPMGPVTAKMDGKSRWKLKFREIECQFDSGKAKGKIRGGNVDLTSSFMIENGRGYIPVASLKKVLPAFLSTSVDVRQDSRRVFIGVAPVRFTARRMDSGRITFTFSAPVNPQIATEQGKLRMNFVRDPLVSDTRLFSFEDPKVTQAAYSETNGAAQLTVTASAPLQATFSEDRRTITVSAMLSSPPPIPQPSAQQPIAMPVPGQQPAGIKTRPHPAIVIDAAHGGDDRGAALTEKFGEKDVTLAFARRLKHELEMRGIPASLLRDSDTSLTLDQRASIANASGASLYLVLHATSYGSGIHLFTAALPSQPRKALAFVHVQSAQSGSIETSRALASAISTEFLKNDVPVTSMPAAVAPLKSVLATAIAVEVAPPPSRRGDELASAAYQQSTAVALANAIAAARSRLPQEIAR